MSARKNKTRPRNRPIDTPQTPVQQAQLSMGPRMTGVDEWRSDRQVPGPSATVSKSMHQVWRGALVSIALLVLAACDNGPKKPVTPPSAPIHMSCMNPQEAGLKAQDITRKLGEALTAKHISDDDYRG